MTDLTENEIAELLGVDEVPPDQVRLIRACRTREELLGVLAGLRGCFDPPAAPRFEDLHGDSDKFNEDFDAYMGWMERMPVAINSAVHGLRELEEVIAAFMTKEIFGADSGEKLSENYQKTISEEGSADQSAVRH